MIQFFTCEIHAIFSEKSMPVGLATLIVATLIVGGVANSSRAQGLNGQSNIAARRSQGGNGQLGVAAYQPQGQASALKRFEKSSNHMGVRFNWVVYASDRSMAIRALDAATNRIEEIEQRLSDYRDDSEVNQLCRTAPHEKAIPVSNDLFQILQFSFHFMAISNRAFDPTLGPLTKLYRRARRNGKLPDSNEIQTARARTGTDNRVVLVSSAGSIGNVEQKQVFAIQLLTEGMHLDFGGIAKGYAADEAAKVLRSHGIQSALIDCSGDIRLMDPPPGKRGWTIAMKDVDPEQAAASLLLSNCGVATSGDLEQYLELDGVRYSHILDPRTGLPCTGQRAVTVVATNATMADAMASAIIVSGPDDGIALANRFSDIQARFVWKRASDDGELKKNERKSLGFGIR